MIGILNYCVTVLLNSVPFLGDASDYLSQQPLPISDSNTGITITPHVPSDSPYAELASTFKCHYPSLPGWESCNGPNSRSCWLRDTNTKQPIFSQFDITTDYEKIWPKGVKREYWLEVGDAVLKNDGFPKQGQAFNRTYPGPLIQACWGDEIVVHVTDKLAENGTTIHWHGIRQLNTNDADGVNGVTQCPIAENNTYTYRFTATQYGHSWYHSHYSLQYPNGVAAPLLIHGPNSANWDVEWDPLFIEDWVHGNAFALFIHELTPQNGLPESDSVLFGGHGQFNGGGSLLTKVVQKGKKVLIRLVNTSSDMFFVFTIDNHSFQVISTDFVPIEPYHATSLNIAIGQRYSIIVDMDQPVDNYWMRTWPIAACSSNNSVIDERTGILRYKGAATKLPTTTSTEVIPARCSDEASEKLKPIVKWEVGTTPANNVTEDTFEVDLVPSRGFNRWEVGRRPLWLNFSDPTLISINNKTFNPDYDIYEFDGVDEWQYIIISGANITNIPNEGDAVFIPGLAHPIHMHGHDFVILGRGNTTYNEDTDPLHFNFHNPPRRDVALLPASGWLAIAFKSDNPGAWLLHCHIAWHASSGLALQILERKKEIYGALGQRRIRDLERTCRGWDNWLAGGERIDQEDSGI